MISKLDTRWCVSEDVEPYIGLREERNISYKGVKTMRLTAIYNGSK